MFARLFCKILNIKKNNNNNKIKQKCFLDFVVAFYIILIIIFFSLKLFLYSNVFLCKTRNYLSLFIFHFIAEFVYEYIEKSLYNLMCC